MNEMIERAPIRFRDGTQSEPVTAARFVQLIVEGFIEHDHDDAIGGVYRMTEKGWRFAEGAER